MDATLIVIVVAVSFVIALMLLMVYAALTAASRADKHHDSVVDWLSSRIGEECPGWELVEMSSPDLVEPEQAPPYRVGYFGDGWQAWVECPDWAAALAEHEARGSLGLPSLTLARTDLPPPPPAPPRTLRAVRERRGC